MIEVVIIFGKTEKILRNFFYNKYCKELNKNSIIALYNTSVDHNRQKRKKHIHSFTARPPAKSCVAIFTEKPVAMVTVMQMR